MRVAFYALILTAMLAPALADPAPVRVAVISDADDKDLAALVTTELSGNPGMVLVERDDLAKAGDELKLQQLAGSDAVALGKLIGADGLICITKGPANGLQVRFTAVDLGYALFDDQIGSQTDLPQLAKSVAHRVVDDVPKLKLTPDQAVPISVLNLRADYTTGDSTALERKLTLLLESRLASLPQYVVLERRHAWSLGFEHSLMIPPKPLLQGAYVVDGALSLSAQNSGGVTIHLRLRSPNNQLTPLEIHGPVDDLRSLVEQMAVEIEKTASPASTPLPWQSQKEARQYLEEGIWAAHHGTCEETIEALDSAELLGESAPDLLAIRIPELCLAAVSALEPVPYGITPRTTANPGPDERIELVQRALSDQTRYEQDHLESKLQTIDPAHSGEGRTWDLHNKVGQAASKVLVMLMNTDNSRAGEIRSKIRSFENYDPLNGKMPGDWGTAVYYANEWSVSMAEELAYYRLIFEKYPDPAWSNFLLDGVLSQDKFCARFLPTPEMRSAACLKFLQDLQGDFAATPLALFYLARKADPSQADNACHAFYNELWAEHEDLLKANRLGHFLRLAFELEKERKVTVSDPKLIALVHYYLQQDTRFADVTLNVWHPEFFPANEAPDLWNDLQAYEKRALAGGGRDHYFESLNRSYTDHFGTQDARPATNRLHLVINRFWYPWLSTDWPEGDFTINLTEADADGLWVSGFGSFQKQGLFKINLPDFSTKVVAPPDGRFLQTLKCTPDALYATYHLIKSGQAVDPQIARLDLKTWTWSVHALPSYFYCTLFNVDRALYLFLNVQFASNEAAVARYDWDADKFTILASSRRLPAQNQFDNTRNYVIDRIFPGPGNKPCMTCYQGADSGTFYIQEGTGTWPHVFDDAWGNQAVTVFDKTLVFSIAGEVALIDPSKAAPEYWMAPTEAHFRKPGPKGTPPLKEQTPWLGQTLWDAPGMRLWPGILGFHDDYFFILIPPKEHGGDFDLLCYQKGKGRLPMHIPLQFHLDDADRASFSKRPGTDLRDLKANQIEHPDAIEGGSVNIVTTNQGLCFKLPFSGFWFLPFSDIDAYLKSDGK